MRETLSCSVARDMLPLLADGLLSPESEAILKEHLAECQVCREIYGQMTDPEPASADETHTHQQNTEATENKED